MYAGVDYDTKAIHVVLLPEEGPARYLPFVMHGHDAFERTRVVRDVMPARGWWEDEGVIAIGIEEPMGQSTRPLNRVQGAVLACLPSSILVQPFMPGEWRNAVELKGNATKEAVAEFVLEMRGLDQALANEGTCQDALWTPVELDEWPQDACDAYCLALAVQKRTEPVAA